MYIYSLSLYGEIQSDRVCTHTHIYINRERKNDIFIEGK